MNIQELAVLKRTQSVLWITVGILLVAEVGYLLNTLFGYLGAFFGLCLLAAVQWYNVKQGSPYHWQKLLVIAVPVLTVIVPLLYLLIEIIFFGDSLFWVQLLFLLCFIVPLFLLVYAIQLIGSLTGDESTSWLDWIRQG